jgi:glycine hydroxymethyltransferase
VRIGTAALTTRGFGVAEARRIAHLLADVLEAPAEQGRLARVARDAQELCDAFPVYRETVS